jgi:hypothetical protein
MKGREMVAGRSGDCSRKGMGRKALVDDDDGVVEVHTMTWDDEEEEGVEWTSTKW